MIAASLDCDEQRYVSAGSVKVAATLVGTGILVARPAIAATVGWSAPIVVAVFGMVLALGLAPPLHREAIRRPIPSINAVAIFGAGALVFVVGRLAAAGHSRPPATALLIALNTLAAVGEEGLFRRLAFDALLAAGPVVAVAGSALLFGLAHVTVYGWWAFPLDVAVGVLFGWQRWVSGTWTIPAATHALADLLVVI